MIKGGTCETYGRGEIHTEFCWGNLKKRDSFVDLGIYSRVVLKCIRKIGWDSVERFGVSEYRMWRAFVYKVTNLSVTRKREEVLEQARFR